MTDDWTEEELPLVEQILSGSDGREKHERELRETIKRCEADGAQRLSLLRILAEVTEPARVARRICDEVMDIAEAIDWDRDSIESLRDKLEQMQAALDRLQRHGDQDIRWAGSRFLPRMKKQIAWAAELIEQIERTGNRGGRGDNEVDDAQPPQ